MKSTLTFLLLATAGTCAAELRFVDPALQFRAGLDTNPVGTSGTTATVLGSRDTLVYAAGAGFGLAWADAARPQSSLKLTYAGDWTRYDRWSGEDYSTHRFGLSAQHTAGDWKFTAEGSSLFVDGSADTQLSVASANANATSLWRERRRQWQHRLKLQAQVTHGALIVRGTGSLLAYDYLTNVVAGRVAFADRSDFMAGLDAGWKQSPKSLWLAGVRAGRQNQAIIPLPNCGFDYANNYTRLALGWEGKLPAGTSLSIAAGPDFRRYTGAIDPAVLLGGRDRTSLWFEAALTAKPSPTWTLAAKATRFAWLSSTGKSAYFDSSAELSATWAPRPVWNVRFSAKAHRCDYYPTARDDWESLLGAGVTRVFSPRVQCALDVLRHQAWNGMTTTVERKFQRATVMLSTTIKL